MARIFQEGFEDGLPYTGYLEGNPSSQYVYNSSFANFPNDIKLATGRNVYSSKALEIVVNSVAGTYRSVTKTLTSSLSELYFRAYYKFNPSTIVASKSGTEQIKLVGADGNTILSIYNDEFYATPSFSVRTRQAGTYASRHTFPLAANTWYKLDIYIKISDSIGQYEVKLDDVSIKSDSGLNLGTSNISSIILGNVTLGATTTVSTYFDDIALNDTSGSTNNSWCGNGTIVSLKPKGAGNKSQWDTCEGYAKAENGTTATNIEVTGHGLATNDVIYNKTRDAYRIVTVVDANNFTVSSVTSQAENDIILLYKNVATITATATTSTSQVTIAGHTMQSGDVIVNTSRSNAIRKVIYVNGSVVYNSYVTTANGTLGSTVTSQAAGDSIKTFAFTPYAMTNHWEAVANQTDPSPKLSYIQSTTSGDIDTFNMEELVADKGLPSNVAIVAVSHNMYAQEAGAGSQIKPVFRIGSSDYEGDAQTLSSGTLQYQKIYETSPATSSAWTQSEIDGLEAGVKLV